MHLRDLSLAIAKFTITAEQLANLAMCFHGLQIRVLLVFLFLFTSADRADAVLRIAGGGFALSVGLRYFCRVGTCQNHL